MLLLLLQLSSRSTVCARIQTIHVVVHNIRVFRTLSSFPQTPRCSRYTVRVCMCHVVHLNNAYYRRRAVIKQRKRRQRGPRHLQNVYRVRGDSRGALTPTPRAFFATQNYSVVMKIIIRLVVVTLEKKNKIKNKLNQRGDTLRETLNFTLPLRHA